MSALTSLLVRDGVVPVRKIEEALQRQVISGGDVETVLLEMDAVPENVLAGYRAALLELAAATREEIMGVEADVIALVPREVAIEHAVIPLAVEGRTLHIAVHEPLSPEETERLGFLLGFDLAPRTATEVRVAAGLAHHYQAELAPRMARLVDKVRGRNAGSLPEVGKVAGARLLSGHAAEIPTKGDDAIDDAPYVGRRRRPSGMLLEPAPPESEPPPASRRRVTSPGMGAVTDAMIAAHAAEPAPEVAEREVAEREVAEREVAEAQVPEPQLEGAAQGHAKVGRERRRSPSLTSLRRLRGPMTLPAGERMLRQASDRDQILEVFFAFARQFFDYTVLFVVHDDMADGRVAYGLGAPTEEVQALEVPLERPSALSEVRRTLAPQVRRLDQTEIDRDVAVGLRRPGVPPALLMPIAIRQRVVLILYGDRDGEAFDIGAVMELVRFAPRVVESFEQLIIRKKRAGYHQEPQPQAGDERARAELKQAVRSVARTAGTGRPSGVLRQRGEWGGRRSSPGFAPTGLAQDDSWGSVERAPKRVRTVHHDPPAHAVVKPPTGGGRETPALDEPSLDAPDRAPASFDSDAPPSAVLGIPRRAPPPPAARLDLGDDGYGGGGFDDDGFDDGGYGDDGFGDEAPEVTFAVADDSAPELVIDVDDDDDEEEEENGAIQVETTEPDDPPDAASRGRLEGVYSLHNASVDVVHATPVEGRRRSSARPRPISDRPRPRSPRDPRREDDDEHGARRPEVVRVPDSIRSEPPRRPPTGLDVETRSVIVDMGDQVAAQVSDLLRVKSTVKRDDLIRGLVAIGDAALPVLAQAFPGPLTWTRGEGRSVPRGRDVSPVARALVAFGERAAPYVAGLLSSAHPDVRFYAALVASELPQPELIDAVAERVHDEDADVRRIAVQLLPRLAGYPGFEEIRTVVRRTARIRGKDLSRRWQAVDAIAALRDVEMLPKLIDLLAEDDDELVEHVHRALVVLTSADHGRSHRRWKTWWERNRDRHRIEWLIDGLTHAEEDVRRLAGDEIKLLTQEYYGYHPGSPRRDRELVAKKYRQWWEQEGQRRFA